jgi:hypothetical protein
MENMPKDIKLKTKPISANFLQKLKISLPKSLFYTLSNGQKKPSHATVPLRLSKGNKFFSGVQNLLLRCGFTLNFQ